MGKLFNLKRVFGISTSLKFPSKGGYQRKKFGGRGNLKVSPLSTKIRKVKSKF